MTAVHHQRCNFVTDSELKKAMMVGVCAIELSRYKVKIAFIKDERNIDNKKINNNEKINSFIIRSSDLPANVTCRSRNHTRIHAAVSPALIFHAFVPTWDGAERNNYPPGLGAHSDRSPVALTRNQSKSRALPRRDKRRSPIASALR
jgi:hypothetical protein